MIPHHKQPVTAASFSRTKCLIFRTKGKKLVHLYSLSFDSTRLKHCLIFKKKSKTKQNKTKITNLLLSFVSEKRNILLNGSTTSLQMVSGGRDYFVFHI